MKRRIALLMAAMMLATTMGSVSLASEISDVVIVADEEESTLMEETEAEVTVEEPEPETSQEEPEPEATAEETESNLLESVEEVASTISNVISDDTRTSGSWGSGDDLTGTYVLGYDGVLTISGTGEFAFYGYDISEVEGPFWGDYCEYITSIVIEDGITAIGEAMFYGCYNLTSVTIPDSVTSIGKGAFYGCSKLENITIPDSVTSIGGWAFKGTPWLKAQGDFAVVGKTLIAYQGNGGTVTIPSGVTEIGEYAFYECSTITSVTIPGSVTTIGNWSFMYCVNLTSVSLGEGITTIGQSAFSNCDSLTCMTVPKTVTSIGYYAIGYEASVGMYGQGSDPIDFTVYGYSGTAAEDFYKNSLNHYVNKESPMKFVALDEFVATSCKISSLTNTSKGITIEWKAVSGASCYYIYRKTSSGSYKKIKTIKNASTLSYTDKSVKDENGTTYTYKVVPYADTTKGASSAKATVRLTGTSLKSVKNSSAGKAKVKWTPVSDVTGYQIQYSTSSSFSSYKTKKVSGATSASKTLSSLTKGKTYYVRIRTYKTVNGKTYYSAWSSKLKVTINK